MKHRSTIIDSAKVLLSVLVFLAIAPIASAGPVHLLRVPDGGIQPQAAVDARGILHLIYFKGDPKGGDLFYTRRAPGDTAFAPSIRANSIPGSVIAVGSIRGGQLALGANGRPHVAWNAAPDSTRSNRMAPMYYTRLNAAGTAFEPQRNVITHAYGLNGGGSVAADSQGHVYVVWHAGGDETGRRVWIARSDDDGATFAPEIAINNPKTGVCGCCGLSAFADRKGTVYVLYRAAGEHIHRDTYLLVSKDHGRTFSSREVQAWKFSACPMSSASFAGNGHEVLGAWETRGQVFFSRVDETALHPVDPSGPGKRRKHPSLALHASGDVLMAWTEGTGWMKGGSLAWQVFTRSGAPTRVAGTADGVPVWSLVDAVAFPKGEFTIVY